jgi:hypothetical protein
MTKLSREENPKVCFLKASHSVSIGVENQEGFVLLFSIVSQCCSDALTISKTPSTWKIPSNPLRRTEPPKPAVIMTLVYVKDEKMNMKKLTNMIDRFPEMDIFKLEGVELEGKEDDIGHPYLDEIHMTNITMTD